MKRTIVILSILIAVSVSGQSNSFPVPSGDAEIKTGKLLLQTDTWRESLLTFNDIHYSPYQTYKFQIESDGLKIKQDNSVNYQFKSGGDFIVNSGKIGIGTLTPGSLLTLNKSGTGAQTSELTIQSNEINVARFGWNANGYVDISSLYNNNHIVLSPTGSGNVGIGTYSPDYKLHIKDGSGGQQLKFQRGTGIATIAQDNNQNDLYIDAPSGLMLNYNGGNVGIGATPASRLHIADGPGGDQLRISRGTGAIRFGQDYNQDNLYLWNSDASQTYMFWKAGGNVGVGTTNPDEKLTVNGTVHANEVKVDLNISGPDYVFEPDYKLLSLEEIKSYIEKNKHLPEVPSAKEMETNGVNVSEMNMLLLKKIEELTLYVIELRNENFQQNQELKSLANDIEKLKNQK